MSKNTRRKRDAVTSAVTQVQEPLRNFLKRAAKKLRPRVVGFLSDRKLGVDTLVEEDVEGFQNQMVDEVATWREVHTLRRWHEKLPILKHRFGALNEHRTDYFSFERLLLSGAGRYVFRGLKCGNQEQALEEVWSGYVALLIGEPCQVTLGASFRTLELGGHSVPLDAQTELRCLTHEERRMIYRRHFWAANEDREEQPGSPSILLDKHRRKMSCYADAFPVLSDAQLQIIRPAIAFMQLFVGEGLKPASIFVLNNRWLPNPVGSISRLSSHVEPYPDPFGSFWLLDDKSQVVDNAALKNLRCAWPKYRDATMDRRYARACSHFSLSLHRDSDEDRIIDHWIALESLFGKESEIANTVALKLAILLEKKLPWRKSCHRCIKSHYGIRSALVHGGDLKGAITRFTTVVNKTMDLNVPAIPKAVCLFSADWVRRSLIRLSEDFGSLKELDDVLLSGVLKRDRPTPPPPAPKPPELLLQLLAAMATEKKKSDCEEQSDAS